MSGTSKKRSPFGMKVKMELIQCGKTSRQLARAVGLADSTICDVLAGRNTCERTRKEIEAVLQQWADGDENQ